MLFVVDGGRFVLWKVYFREEKEAVYFGKMLSSIDPAISFQWTRNTYWGNEIQIDKKVSIRYIILCFVSVLKEYRLQPMMLQLIRDEYHYDEETELQQILQWSIAVMYEQPEVKRLFEQKTLEKYLFLQLYEQLQFVQKLHFDAIIAFCMKPLKAKLIDLIGLAIDEMRQEEAYQNYLQAMRTYVATRSPKCELIYVVERGELSLYNAQGNMYSDVELVEMMKKEPLYLIGLDENEKTLAPLLTLLPQKIFIYCNQPLDTKVATILNVFEERVQLFTKSSFPFPYNLGAK